MTDSELMTRWVIAVVCGGAVILVAAALLLLIVREARGILAAAVRCLVAVQRIRENVQPIWALEETNRVADRLVGGARSIEASTRLLADTLEAHEPQAPVPTVGG